MSFLTVWNGFSQLGTNPTQYRIIKDPTQPNSQPAIVQRNWFARKCRCLDFSIF